MGSQPGVPEAPGINQTFLPRATTWNAMRDRAVRLDNITVTPPLTITNGPGGATISFQSPMVSLAFGVVKGPDETSSKGRVLIKLVPGPIKYDATGDFSKDDLGKVPDDNDETAIIVEGWGQGVDGLSTDMPVWGWHIGNRGDDMKGRQIFLVAGGGSLPLGQYQGMIAQMLTDNQVGYDYLCSHAMEP